VRWAILAGVVIAGAIIRWCAAYGDLWFDEIWSMLLTTRAHSFSGVFTEIHHANNHYLNTAYLMLLGPGARPEVYRLPAIIAGSIAVGLMAIVAVNWPAGGRRGAFTIAWFGAGSFFLVQYSSEARGYGLAVLFAMLCYIATAAWVEVPRWWSACGFALAAILGIFAHLTVAFVVAGCLAWVVVDALESSRPWAFTSSSILAFGAPIGTVFAWLWMVDLRTLDSGGGPPWSAAAILRESLRSTLNLPSAPIEWLGVVALIGAGWEMIRLYRAKEARWAFFATVFAIPLAVCVATHPEILASRYFLVCAPFLLILVGEWLARVSNGGIFGRLIWASALSAFAAGGVALWGPLVREGRGQYSGAMAYMASATADPVLRIASDHDLRNGLLLGYFGRGLSPAKHVDYVSHDEWRVRSFDWFIVHRTADEDSPPPVLDLPPGRFAVARRFCYGGMSGWNWFVYRRSSLP
jgi:hypothetical protein